VAGIHGLEHVEGFAATALADDNAIGAHAQGVLQQVANRNLAAPFDARGTGLKAHDMVLGQA